VVEGVSALAQPVVGGLEIDLENAAGAAVVAAAAVVGDGLVVVADILAVDS